MKNETKNYKLTPKGNIKLKAEYLIDNIHDCDVSPQYNQIFLFGIDRGYEVAEGIEEPGVDFVMANRFIRNMVMCMNLNPKKDILIHMKTRGGSWEEGMAIYDSIRACPTGITILNYTHARSMSSIIFQAANKRVMMPNSIFMFHNGTFGIEGTQKMVESTLKFYSKTSTNTMLEIYAHRMKEPGKKYSDKSLVWIKKWLKDQMDKKEDVYLTAKETVELGLADEIFDYNWDNLTVYTSQQLER